MSELFEDIDKLRISQSEILENQQKLAANKGNNKELLPPRHKKGETFICGPIPISWVKEMLKLPASASQISYILWFQAGIKKVRTFDVNLSKIPEFNISKATAYRSIGYLEKANLISVKREPGRKLKITLLDIIDK